MARNGSRRDVGLGGSLAIGADPSHFSAGDRYLYVAIARDLLLQFFVKRAFDLAHFPATQAGDVNVIARAVAFVEMAVAAEMEQVQLVD